MANKHRGEVPFQLGDLDLVLKFDTNAIAELETALDDHFTSIMSSLQEGDVSIRFIRAAIFAGLQHDKRYSRGMTLSKVGKLITFENLAELTGVIAKAILLMQGADPNKIDEMMGGAAASDPTKETKDPEEENKSA
jgi:hypothetical protein